jgi:hypothetical protein
MSDFQSKNRLKGTVADYIVDELVLKKGAMDSMSYLPADSACGATRHLREVYNYGWTDDVIREKTKDGTIIYRSCQSI